MSTFESLIKELTRDVKRVQPRDSLQFCANWFQSRLEEQRTRTRDILASQRRSFTVEVPINLYGDVHFSANDRATTPPSLYRDRPSRRTSMAPSSFPGTLNVAGNALLSPDDEESTRGSFNFDRDELPPTSPLSVSTNHVYPSFDPPTPTSHTPGDFLHPLTSTILARRTSVSAESIAVDSAPEEPLPVYPKTADQIRRIKASIAKSFIFRDLDEEQMTNVLNAMQELYVERNKVVIRQGDVGDYFYVVESGLLHCYIRPEPLPSTWLTSGQTPHDSKPEDTFVQPGYHPEFGKQVQECLPGSYFGELALMYGHRRAASVLSIEPSTLWSLDRITFRTIILTSAHKRRSMYEKFLSTVTLLSSLEPGERSKVADALVSKVYQDGEAIVRQGEMGDTFFFVEEGEAVVTKLQRSDGGQVHEITVGRLVKGDYFGELSLLRRAPRAATVSAVNRDSPSDPKLKVAALDATAFTRLLGPLRDIMERKAGESY